MYELESFEALSEIQPAPSVAPVLKPENPGDRDNEICSAIAMALDEYMDTAMHDMESYVITIRRR